MKQIFLIIGFLFLQLITSAQIPDSVGISQDSLKFGQTQPDTSEIGLTLDKVARIDTTETKKKKRIKFNLKSYLKDDYPNPKKSFLLSGIIPGAGQIYNKKLWYIKVPIIYGGLATFIALIRNDRQLYVTYRDAYLARFDNDPNNERFTALDNRSLQTLRNQTRKGLEQKWVFLILFHVIQSAEAFIQGHLLTFDVSDDLSLRFDPSLERDYAQNTYLGVGVTLSIK